AVRAGRGEPFVAMAFWRRSFEEFERLWRTRWQAIASGAVGLACCGVCAAWLQHEANAPADGDLRRLPASLGSGGRRFGESKERSERHHALALSIATFGCGTDLGFAARRGGRPGFESGWPLVRHGCRWR